MPRGAAWAAGPPFASPALHPSVPSLAALTGSLPLTLPLSRSRLCCGSHQSPAHQHTGIPDTGVSAQHHRTTALQHYVHRSNTPPQHTRLSVHHNTVTAHRSPDWYYSPVCKAHLDGNVNNTVPLVPRPPSFSLTHSHTDTHTHTHRQAGGHKVEEEGKVDE